MESLTTLTDVIVNTILAPLLIIVGSTILVVVKSYADKITNSIVSKNETEALHSVTQTKVNLLDELDTVVDAAVASNMQFAEELRAKHEKLTAEEARQLKKSAEQLIYNSLPPSLLDPNGALSKVVGGREKLESLVEGLIEKHVFQQKLEMQSAKG